MRKPSLVLVGAFAFLVACGGGQAPQPAPAPEAAPAPAVEAPAPAPVVDAGVAEAAPAEPAPPALKTPENLQAAYAAETDAVARYNAFAEAADAEKYKSLAALFRAAARAEDVHAKNIAEVITGQGGTPVAGTAKPEVKKSAENLKAALAADSNERDTVFPGYADTAKAEGNGAAERALRGVAEAEGGFVKHLQKAVKDGEKDVANWKRADKTYWVCSMCGNVMTSKKNACDICGTDPSAFDEMK